MVNDREYGSINASPLMNGLKNDVRTMINQVCYRGLDQPESWTLSAYQKLGGYQGGKLF